MRDVPRLDWLLQRAGLVRRARTWSAFVVDDALHLLHVGRGWARLGVTDGAYQGIADAVHARIHEEVRRNLAVLDEVDLAAEVPARAELSWRLADVTSLRVVELGDGVARWTLRATTRPTRFSVDVQDHLGDRAARLAFEALLPNVTRG